MKEGEHPFWFLFPDLNPDPQWAIFYEKNNSQIRHLVKSNQLLDAFILTIQNQITYFLKERDPGDPDFAHWISAPEFMRLVTQYPDFRYIYALCWMDLNWPTQEFLHVMLNSLIAMKENHYTPMSQESKIKVQQRFYNRILKDEDNIAMFVEIIGDEDVVSGQNSERN